MRLVLPIGENISLLCLLRAAIFATGYIYSANSLAAGAKIPVVVVDQSRKAEIIKQVPLTGTVTSSKRSRLSPQISGYVNKVKVDVGDSVKKGDVLIQLNREIEALTLQAISAETQKKREELANAERRFESAKRLRKQNSISVDEIDQRESDVNITKAALQYQMAEEKKQQALVEQHTVYAPFDCIVSEKLTEVGQWIEPGKPVLTLVAVNGLMIDFQVPQEYFPRLNNSSRISLKLPAGKNKQYETDIDVIVPVSDPVTRTFRVRVKANMRDVSMMPGMSSSGVLRLDSGKRGVVVSRDALLRYPDGRVTVWVVKQEDEVAKVSERPVKVGHGFDGQVSILEGLEAGVIVVVQGNESLKEDQIVRIYKSQ